MAIEVLPPRLEDVGSGLATPEVGEVLSNDDPRLQRYMMNFADEHQKLLDLTYAEQLKKKAPDLVASAGMAIGMPFAFEAEWLAVTGGAAAATHNTLVAAGVGAVFTAGVEIAGALGSSRLLSSETGGRVIGWAHKQLGRLGISGKVDTKPVTDAAIALVAGTGVMMTAKQIANPERSKAENKSYATKVGLTVSAIGAPVGYAVSEGVANVSFETVGVAGLAIAGLFAVRRGVENVVKKRIDRLQRDEEIRQNLPTEPDYNLSEERHDLIERDLVKRARKKFGRTVVAFWLEGHRPEANIVRTEERRALPKVSVDELFEEYESSSLFLAVVDTRRSAGKKGRLIRGARLTGRHSNEGGTSEKDEDVARDGGTDLAMIRDLVKDGQLTGTELLAYYEKTSIDLAKCVSVETNLRVGDRARKRLGMLSISQLTYQTIYNHVLRGNTEARDAAIFAHINKATVSSLARFGVMTEHIAGRDDLRTPASKSSGKEYDDDFVPAAMTNTPKTQRAMRLISPFYLSEIYLG